jgi:homoserine kinase type II
MAVYTHISAVDLAGFLSAYEIGRVVSCEGIPQGVENTNYRVVTTQGQFVLTLYEKRIEPADLPFFLGLMAYLADRGVSCPRPVATQQGALLDTIAGHPAALATFLPGVSLETWDETDCFAVGAALADLHLKAKDYPGHRANALGPEGWKSLADKTRERADEVAPGLAELIADELDFLGNAGPRGLPLGIIHADLFPDNVLFEGGKISGIIDFYFACTDLLAYDLAIALNSWCFDEKGFDRVKGKNLLAGYQSKRPLQADEIAALPILARGAALRFLLTRLYDWLSPAPGALVKPHDPLAYRDRLLFHRKIEDATAYE